VKVAFHGQRGSYAEAAAAWMSAGADIATVACASFAAVVSAVTSGDCQAGVVRVATPDAGISEELVDLLRGNFVYFNREIRFHERYNLAGQADGSAERVRRVYAHPVIMNLCSGFLSRLGNTQLIARFDSAESLAELLRRGDPGEAIVCSDFAADIFGLRVLASGVENRTEGETRFMLISGELRIPDNGAREVATSALIEVRHEPGALVSALSTFKRRGVNLCGVHARPNRTGRDDFMALLEFDGCFDDPNVRAALDELEGFTSSVQVLGSYHRVEPPVPLPRFVL
jgi:prephenate dehydratase